MPQDGDALAMRAAATRYALSATFGMPLAASPVMTVGATGCWPPVCVGRLARTIDPAGAPAER